MKTLVVLLSVVICGGALEIPYELHQEFIAAVTPFISVCECDTNVDPHLVYELIYNLEFSNDACLRCFIKCLFFKLDFVNPDYSPNYDAAEKGLVVNIDSDQISRVTPLLSVRDSVGRNRRITRCILTKLTLTLILPTEESGPTTKPATEIPAHTGAMADEEVPAELHQQFITAVTPFISICDCETHVDPHLAYMLIHHLEFTNDACLRCFLNCVKFKLYCYKSDNTPDYDKIVNSIPFVNRSVLVNCFDQQNTTDMCQLSFEVTKCVANYYKI
ncbi:hypothetical protein FQR65_LT13501 [Abscondita terminalis]|nr:hypothetical protein FQR65_LT13501 [Abscondita terminalis]